MDLNHWHVVPIGSSLSADDEIHASEDTARDSVYEDGPWSDLDAIPCEEFTCAPLD